MALVVYRDQVNGVEISKKMFPPKKVSSLDHWLKEARKVVSQIPREADTKNVINTQVSARWIAWEIFNHKDERSYVIIDRSVPSIG
jgi:hypothetical protein